MKKAFCYFAFFFLAQIFFSLSFENNLKLAKFARFSIEAKSKKSASATKHKKSKNLEEEINLPITKITVDESKKTKAGYFSRINAEILNLVQEGSAESLSRALHLLKKANVDYEECEAVLVFVASEILKVVWPSHRVALEFPQVPLRNAYIGALESARNGIYDTSTGKTDFLSTILPSLILCNPNFSKDNSEQAQKDLLCALAMDEESVLANYLFALLCVKNGEYENAIFHLKKASKKSAAFEINFNLAVAQNLAGQNDESQKIANKLIVLQPANMDLLKLLAKNAFAKNDYDLAEQYALLVLTQNPSDLEMILFRAKIFVCTDEFLKAASLLDVYAKSNSTNKEYLILRTRVQKEWNKNLAIALATIEKALSLYPQDTEVLLYAAELAFESGAAINGKTGAELSYEILALDQENLRALSFLIRTMTNEGQWQSAYDMSKKLIEKTSSMEKIFAVETISTHIKICLELALFEEAWSAATSLYEKFPGEEKAIQAYVEAMAKTGRIASALRFINANLGDASNSLKSFFYFQRSFFSSNENSQLADLRSAVIANPRNTAALFRMYSIYFQNKDFRKAQYYLRQVIAMNPNNANYLKLNSELDALLGE